MKKPIIGLVPLFDDEKDSLGCTLWYSNTRKHQQNIFPASIRKVKYMAHTACPNGHDMWNGDGKPVVWAFRANYFREFMREHPDCILDMEDEDNRWWQIYDCVDEVPGEDLDCWYCDECKGLTVFVDIYRYDFQYIENTTAIAAQDVSDWEEYIALRDRAFESFQDFYAGMSPIDAIEKYDFEYMYRVSPDKKTILAFGRDGKAAFGFKRSQFRQFSPDLEIRYISGSSIKPYQEYKGKVDFCVEPGQYAFLKDKRIIHIDKVKGNEIYVGRDINKEGLPVVEFKYQEIESVVDEICKNVIVE